MNIKNALAHIKNRLFQKQEMPDEVVLKFVQILENIRSEQMSCEDMYAQLDEFVERELKSHDASRIMPLIQEHIDMCPDCCDEYESLLDILEHTDES